ncbi:MAG: PQQ-binding-like beta-propeller repeat protein [Thermoguttaceae bacterium]|nr:PQQ-binding-like beta-propeller repeat protein [Thermoguttaceae bacterium]
MSRPSLLRRDVLPWLLMATCMCAAALSEDRPQWGQRYSRNMVSDEKGLPDGFDPKTGRNVLWSAALGTECYSTPVVAGGKVLIGTNNSNPRDPRHEGDRGVMMCFDEKDGRLAWQLVVPKLEGDIYLDWPNAGMCSPATVEGDRVYTVTNRDEAVCLDLLGLANGNDGPYRDEGRHMTPRDKAAMEPGPLDADILWLFDLRTGAGVRPHDSAHSSILLDGQFLYINTSNGLNSQHTGVEKPEAPSLIVLDKGTGRLVAKDAEQIGPRIFHSTWSSPALGQGQGRRTVVFGGGDGVVYGFEALGPLGATDEVRALARSWRFDCDPTAPKENVHRYIRNRRESPSNIKGMPVFHEGRVYVAAGGDIWWGKDQAWLFCIDATQTGDITKTGLVWTYPLDRHCCSTPSVHEGLVYIADCGGKVHCVDARSGKPYWVHDARGEMWASTLVADGKVYIGTRRGDFLVLAAGREKRLLSSIRLPDPVISTPVAANGTLYVGTMSRLYALKTGAHGASATVSP